MDRHRTIDRACQPDERVESSGHVDQLQPLDRRPARRHDRCRRAQQRVSPGGRAGPGASGPQRVAGGRLAAPGRVVRARWTLLPGAGRLRRHRNAVPIGVVLTGLLGSGPQVGRTTPTSLGTRQAIGLRKRSAVGPLHKARATGPRRNHRHAPPRPVVAAAGGDVGADTSAAGEAVGYLAGPGTPSRFIHP